MKRRKPIRAIVLLVVVLMTDAIFESSNALLVDVVCACYPVAVVGGWVTE